MAISMLVRDDRYAMLGHSTKGLHGHQARSIGAPTRLPHSVQEPS